MFIVISYDIPDDRRRTKVMKTLKNYGRHVQYSVFECELKTEDYQRLRQKLKELVDLQQDSIRFYVLSQEDLKKRRIWGAERSPAEMQAWYLVRQPDRDQA
jgi:CRISPR-associated protein Cas2